MSSKSIAVIGNGFVGGSLTTVFAERGFVVNVCDKAGRFADGANPRCRVTSVEELVHKCEVELASCPNVKFSGVYFVCLPTPMKSDGDADLSIVDGVLEQLACLPGERIAVVKSTVPPGSTEHWNNVYGSRGLKVVFNPEFLTEANALNDMRNQNRIVLGGPRSHINTVRDLFRTAFPNVPIHKTSSTNAELVKYVTNTFLMTKVLFANEIYEMCEKLNDLEVDVDYDRIIELATLDDRLGKSHWKVPGPMPADDGSGRLLRGCAGSCFIKDLNALISFAKKINVNPKILDAVWEKNLDVRPERDWEKLVGRAVSEKKNSD